jgi:hypothetical protein
VAAVEITVRVWGTLVLIAGCVLVAGAIGLLQGTVRGRALATVASLLGVALGVMTILAQLVNDKPDPRLLLWAAIIVISAGSAWIVRSVTPPEERGAGVWVALPFLRSVVSVGLLVSIGQFWYTSIYIPTTAPASLTVETKLDAAAHGERVVLTGNVTLRNTSSTRVNLLASTMQISGERVLDGEDTAFEDNVVDAHVNGGYVTRFAQASERTVVAEGPLLPDYLDAGETVTQPIVAWVARDQFDLASLDVAAVIARGRALALEDADPPEVSAGENSTVVVTSIPAAGWLRRLTRGDRYVRVEYPRDGVTGPSLMFVSEADAAPGHEESFSRRMWRFYGTNGAVGQSKVSLETL